MRISDWSSDVCSSDLLKHPRLHVDLRDYVGLIFESAAATLRSYAERKRELGVLDFTDQESLLLRALDNPAISATLADELDLLLVDEFQDTSPIQLALFMKLTALAAETFWVGDIRSEEHTSELQSLMRISYAV